MLFFLIQARRDERPDLVQHNRHGNKQRDKKRQLEWRQERRCNRRRNHLLTRKHIDERLRHDGENFLRERNKSDKQNENRSCDLDEAAAQFDQVR